MQLVCMLTQETVVNELTTAAPLKQWEPLRLHDVINHNMNLQSCPQTVCHKSQKVVIHCKRVNAEIS
jgi:hypothetical protein